MAKNSLLTTNQRKWLKGRDVYERPDRQVKHAIKQRFIAGHKDAKLLHHSDIFDEDEKKELLAKFERFSD